MKPSSRQVLSFAAVAGLALAGLLLASPAIRPHQESGKSVEPAPDASAPARFATTIRPTPGPQGIPTGLTDPRGHPVTVACASCHATTTPNRDLRSSDQLVQFHQGLHYAHGALSCLSCHNADNYETLRLADGSALAFTDSMTLCGQCHGPQLRDYQRGLHGGMNGYWDLSRGPRTRNSCIHCHDPHAPAFPVVQPVFPPRDRMPVPRPDSSHAH